MNDVPFHTNERRGDREEDIGGGGSKRTAACERHDAVGGARGFACRNESTPLSLLDMPIEMLASIMGALADEPRHWGALLLSCRSLCNVCYLCLDPASDRILCLPRGEASCRTLVRHLVGDHVNAVPFVLARYRSVNASALLVEACRLNHVSLVMRLVQGRHRWRIDLNYQNARALLHCVKRCNPVTTGILLSTGLVDPLLFRGCAHVTRCPIHGYAQCTKPYRADACAACKRYERLPYADETLDDSHAQLHQRGRDPPNECSPLREPLMCYIDGIPCPTDDPFTANSIGASFAIRIDDPENDYTGEGDESLDDDDGSGGPAGDQGVSADDMDIVARADEPWPGSGVGHHSPSSLVGESPFHHHHHHHHEPDETFLDGRLCQHVDDQRVPSSHQTGPDSHPNLEEAEPFQHRQHPFAQSVLLSHSTTAEDDRASPQTHHRSDDERQYAFFVDERAEDANHRLTLRSFVQDAVIVEFMQRSSASAASASDPCAVNRVRHHDDVQTDRESAVPLEPLQCISSHGIVAHSSWPSSHGSRHNESAHDADHMEMNARGCTFTNAQDDPSRTKVRDEKRDALKDDGEEKAHDKYDDDDANERKAYESTTACHAERSRDPTSRIGHVAWSTSTSTSTSNETRYDSTMTITDVTNVVTNVATDAPSGGARWSDAVVEDENDDDGSLGRPRDGERHAAAPDRPPYLNATEESDSIQSLHESTTCTCHGDPMYIPELFWCPLFLAVVESMPILGQLLAYVTANVPGVCADNPWQGDDVDGADSMVHEEPRWLVPRQEPPKGGPSTDAAAATSAMECGHDGGDVAAGSVAVSFAMDVNESQGRPNNQSDYDADDALTHIGHFWQKRARTTESRPAWRVDEILFLAMCVVMVGPVGNEYPQMSMASEHVLAFHTIILSRLVRSREHLNFLLLFAADRANVPAISILLTYARHRFDTPAINRVLARAFWRYAQLVYACDVEYDADRLSVLFERMGYYTVTIYSILEHIGSDIIDNQPDWQNDMGMIDRRTFHHLCNLLYPNCSPDAIGQLVLPPLYPHNVSALFAKDKH